MMTLINDYGIEGVLVFSEVKFAHCLHCCEGQTRANIDLATCNRAECLAVNF